MAKRHHLTAKNRPFVRLSRHLVELFKKKFSILVGCMKCPKLNTWFNQGFLKSAKREKMIRYVRKKGAAALSLKIGKWSITTNKKLLYLVMWEYGKLDEQCHLTNLWAHAILTFLLKNCYFSEDQFLTFLKFFLRSK